MSWFGEGLSSLKGQLQNFTKEVLADGEEENSGPPPTESEKPESMEAKQKFQEIEALCEAKSQEISALREKISQLLKKPPDLFSEVDNYIHNDPWWTVDQKCDPGNSSATKEASLAVTGGRKDMTIDALEKKLEEKDDLINKQKEQLQQMEKEIEKVHDLERQIEQWQLERSDDNTKKQTAVDILNAKSQPDIIHGTVGALEQENKILKQRIVELELLVTPTDVVEEEIKMEKSEEIKEPTDGMVSCAYLKSEIEALEKVIQDLESQLAHMKEENDNLNSNIDELDKQHQAAIDQLLHAKSTLQKQNEKLESELQDLKIKADEKVFLNIEIQILQKENEALKDELKAVKERSNDLVSVANSDTVENFKSELWEKLTNVITCDIPKDFFSNKHDVDIINTAEALNKMCADYKWKKETLERKVVEMMKEITVSKQNLTEHEETIKLLENECKILRSNVESLFEELLTFKHGTDEVLAPIPENSEDIETLAQKITNLENEVDILREARSNLEADAAKLREHESMLMKQLNSAEAALRNQENIYREMSKKQEIAENENRQLKELLESKLEIEAEVQKLRMQEDAVKEVRHNNETLYKELCSEKSEKLTLAKKLAECENEKSLLEKKVSFLQEKVSEAYAEFYEDRQTYDELMEGWKFLEQQLLAVNSMFLLRNDSDSGRSSRQSNDQLSLLNADLTDLYSVIKSLERMKDDVQTNIRLRNYEHNKLMDANKKIKISEKLNKLLHRKLNVEYIDLEELAIDESALQRKLNEIESLDTEGKNQLKGELEAQEPKLENLNQEIINLRQQEEKCKKHVEIIDKLQEECKNLQTQINSKDKEISCIKHMLATSECINAVFHRKLNINYEGVEALRRESSYIQQHINEIENMTVKDENYVKNLMSEMQQKDCLIQELTICNESLVKRLKNLQENLYTNFWDENSSEESLQNKDKEEKLKKLIFVKDEELSQKQHEILKLQLQCQKLCDVETALVAANKEITYWKSEFATNQEKLKEEMKRKNDLISSSEHLKLAEEDLRSKEFQEIELKELQESMLELQESMVVLKTKYDELHSSKLKMETDLQKYKNSDISGTKSRINDKNLSNVCRETESNKLVALIDSEQSFVSRHPESNNSSITPINLQNNLVATPKETIENLSKIIKSNDIEIADLKEKNVKTVEIMENLQQKVSQLQFEKDELVKTIHIKHQESIQYHKEIQRLSGLLSEELQKSEDIQQKYKGALKQHEEKQKLLINTQNEVMSLKKRLEKVEARYISQSSNAEVEGNVAIREGNHTDELKSVISNKDQIIENMLSKLNLCEEELKLKQQEINVLREQSQSNPNTLLELENATIQVQNVEDEVNQFPQNMIGSQSIMELSRENNSLKEQVKQLEQECRHLTENLQEQQTKAKYLEEDLLERKERESSLAKELERLREHLVTVEDSYTQEMLRTEQQVHSLQARLNEAEERLKSSSTAYTSASILVNQQVEALQNQSHSLTQQRDEAFSKLSAAEDKVQKHEAALQNLQAVLEQFQKDKEREIAAEVLKVKNKLFISETKREELIVDKQLLKIQLVKANEGLSAASRLGEEIEKKSETIAILKVKVMELTEKLEKTEQIAKLHASSENKVDRNLIKNLIVGYFSAPAAGKTQVLHVLANVLEMCPDELTKLGIGSMDTASNQSLSEAFIRFLENESRPQPKLRLLPLVQESASMDRSTPSPSTSNTGSRRSPLLLSEVQLPTFTQFPAARSSSSILKDVLKEN